MSPLRDLATAATCRAALALTLLCAAAGAQIHKDGRIGFQFKPPKDFAAIALNPTERTVVAKYQSEQKEHSASGVSNPTFEVSFYPSDRIDGDRDEWIASTRDAISRGLGYAEITHERTTRIDRADATEWYIEPDEGSQSAYVVVLPLDDGVFWFTGIALKERFKKYTGLFSKAVKSFKRIDKEDRSERQAELEQMSDQERYLQAQIDKLPPDWEYLRTDRYLFLFNAEKNWVKELAERIEAVRDLLEDFFPPEEPITAISIVRVCANRDQYMAYGGSAGSGGYWSSFHKELVIFDKSPRKDTEATVNHEAFHQYIYYFYGELAPHSWYNEGTGDYLAGARMTKSYRPRSYGDPPGGIRRQEFVKEAARQAKAGLTGPGVATPLRDLMRYTQQEYYSNGGKHYAQGWALIHMLRESKRLEPKWERILGDYMVNLVAARTEVAIQTRDRAMEQAEKKEPGSAAELPTEPEAWFGRSDRDAIQRLAYDKTFADWSDQDWEAFNASYLDYVEKL